MVEYFGFGVAGVLLYSYPVYIGIGDTNSTYVYRLG
jgi:hypothetical protein